jgi:hypothetical protein
MAFTAITSFFSPTATSTTSQVARSTNLQVARSATLQVARRNPPRNAQKKPEADFLYHSNSKRSSIELGTTLSLRQLNESYEIQRPIVVESQPVLLRDDLIRLTSQYMKQMQVSQTLICLFVITLWLRNATIPSTQCQCSIPIRKLCQKISSPTLSSLWMADYPPPSPPPWWTNLSWWLFAAKAEIPW